MNMITGVTICNYCKKEYEWQAMPRQKLSDKMQFFVPDKNKVVAKLQGSNGYASCPHCGFDDSFEYK